MSEKPRRKGSVSEGKGAYILLLLCVAAIGLTGFLLTRGMLAMQTGGFGRSETAAVGGQADLEDTRQTVRPRPEPTPVPAEQKASSAVPKETEETAAVPEKTQAQPAAEEEPEDPARETALYVWPVEGTVDRGFSLEVFAYDATMGDWRTHSGLDIAAETGVAVGACAPGTVESVTRDDLLGTMVTIDHGAGLKSIYANLDETLSVDEGDPVEAGTVIGAVGATALAETAGPSHLHFAMAEYGVPVDPLNYLK